MKYDPQALQTLRAPRIGVGAWSKGSSGASKASTVDPTGMAAVTSDSLATAANVGDESLDGVGVYHLRVSRTHISSGAVSTPVTTTTTNDIYIRRDTAHPYKIVTHVKSGSTPTSTITLTFMAYDSGVTIDLPQA